MVTLFLCKSLSMRSSMLPSFYLSLSLSFFLGNALQTLCQLVKVSSFGAFFFKEQKCAESENVLLSSIYGLE